MGWDVNYLSPKQMTHKQQGWDCDPSLWLPMEKGIKCNRHGYAIKGKPWVCRSIWYVWKWQVVQCTWEIPECGAMKGRLEIWRRKGVKRYRLPFRRTLSPGDVTCNMMAGDNTALWCTWQESKSWLLITGKKTLFFFFFYIYVRWWILLNLSWWSFHNMYKSNYYAIHLKLIHSWLYLNKNHISCSDLYF